MDRSIVRFVFITVLALGGTPATAQSWLPAGPTGGTVRALASDPRDPGRVYLGTGEGILYRSDDAGLHWTRLTPGFPLRGCSLDEIVVDDDGVVSIGYWKVDAKGGGVARSTDGGQSFTILKGVDGESVRALAVAPSDSDVLAAGTSDGVFLTRDAGRTWKRITPRGHPELRNVASAAFDPGDSRILYVGTRHLGWKTIDGGAEWLPIHKGMVDDSHVMTLSVDRQDRRTVYATACTGIYRSRDGAQAWTKIAGIPDTARRTLSFFAGGSDGLLLAGTTQGLWISEDQGRNWHDATARDLVINAVLAEGTTLLLGTENAGVLRSTDGGRSWSESNQGFSEHLLTRIVFAAAGRPLLVLASGDARHGGVFAAENLGGEWRHLDEGLDGRRVLSLTTLGKTIVAGTDDGVFTREPKAAAWTRLSSTTATPNSPRLRVSELISGRGRLLAATSSGVIRSDDAGSTWSPSTLGPRDAITAFAASPRDPDCIVAAGRAGIYRSSDGGASWKPLSPGLKGVIPHTIAFLPTDDRVLFATTSRGLFRSDDEGASWRRINGGIPHSDLTGLAIHPDGRTMFASDFTWGGVFRSLDGGATWSRLPIEGLGSERVWALAIDPTAPERLLAASVAGGLHVFESEVTAAR